MFFLKKLKLIKNVSHCFSRKKMASQMVFIKALIVGWDQKMRKN